MNTVFEFRILHAKPDYARQAARAAFEEIDRLECLLSRFVDGSDVWRINHARVGETVHLSEEAHDCLMQAIEMTRVTHGAFNVTVGGAAELVRKKEGAKIPVAKLREALLHSAQAEVALSPDDLCVQILRRGISIDLGAIGKGFVLDRVRALFAEWEIKHALLNAGDSSVLAYGSLNRAPAPGKPMGWTINFAAEKQSTPFVMHDCSLGSSGTSINGRHIIDPRRGGQNYTYTRTWAIAPSAAVADALSTACMTMMPGEITSALRELGKGHAVITEDTNGRLHMGRRSGEWSLIRRGHSLSWPPS